MALDPDTAVVSAEQGETTMRANIIHRIRMAGDAAYVAAGSAGFQAVARLAVGEQITLTSVVGHMISAAGALTHIAHYNTVTDTLQLFEIGAGANPAGPSDFSTATLHLTLF